MVVDPVWGHAVTGQPSAYPLHLESPSSAGGGSSSLPSVRETITTMKKKQSKKSVKYTPEQIKSIVSFMRQGNSNGDTKKKFGCSRHWASHLRKEHKLKPAAPAPKAAKAKPAKPAKAAPKAKAKGKGKPASDLL